MRFVCERWTIATRAKEPICSLAEKNEAVQGSGKTGTGESRDLSFATPFFSSHPSKNNLLGIIRDQKGGGFSGCLKGSS